MNSTQTCANRVANSWHTGLLREHIEGKISGSELMFWPFPHSIIQDFFPEEVYEEIIKRNLFRETVERNGLQ